MDLCTSLLPNLPQTQTSDQIFKTLEGIPHGVILRLGSITSGETTPENITIDQIYPEQAQAL